jgi:hypothetical protein
MTISEEARFATAARFGASMLAARSPGLMPILCAISLEDCPFFGVERIVGGTTVDISWSVEICNLRDQSSERSLFSRASFGMPFRMENSMSTRQKGGGFRQMCRLEKKLNHCIREQAIIEVRRQP